jgi:hypothetical protein
LENRAMGCGSLCGRNGWRADTGAQTAHHLDDHPSPTPRITAPLKGVVLGTGLSGQILVWRSMRILQSGARRLCCLASKKPPIFRVE